MKKLCLYQVFDNIGQSAITSIIPSTNDLTAALGFRNAYIKEKDPQKNPFGYKTLDLKKVAELVLDENGLVVEVQPARWTISGKEIMSFIQEEMNKLGVDDFILDDEEES